jgi:arsenate reductase
VLRCGAGARQAGGDSGDASVVLLLREDAMDKQVYNVLFVCTGNSARSIIAEAIMNNEARGRFKAYSAGSHPTGKVNPFALEALRDLRIPTDGFRSKSWEEFSRPDSPQLDFVFTVCDQAAGEQCPFWPGQPMTAHWGLPDPAAFEGGDDEKRKRFRDTAVTLKRRIDLMLSLPIESLDSMSLQHEIKDIGKR